MNCVFLCDISGVMAKPWANAGYTCHLVDVQHPPGITKDGNIIKYGMKVENFTMPKDVKFAIAFPPCTDLAGSGARWWEQKGDIALKNALKLVKNCWNKIKNAESYVLENPVGRLSSNWRKPDFYFDPCDYGGYIKGNTGLRDSKDAYTKKTCLWSGGNFVMPEKKRVEPILGSIMLDLRSSNERSKTPKGFAIAVFKSNN